MPASNPNFIAGGDISPCRFVKAGAADFTVLQADANAAIIGVSQEGTRRAPGLDGSDTLAAIAGEGLEVHGLGEECLIEASGVIARFSYVAADADGKAVLVNTGAAGDKEVGGQLLEDATADGHKVRMLIKPFRYTEA